MSNVAERVMPKRKSPRAPAAEPAAAEPAAASKPFGRPPKPTGEPTQVRVDADIAALAKMVAPIEGVSMTDLLSGILRPILQERAREAGRKLIGE